MLERIGDMALLALAGFFRRWRITLPATILAIGFLQPEQTLGVLRDGLDRLFGRFLLPLVAMLWQEYTLPVLVNIGIPALAGYLVFRSFKRAKKK